MLEAYRKHVAERAEIGVVPKPLSADQVAGLIELLKQPPAGEEDFLLELLSHRVPPGVDEAAYLKAGFLSALAKGEASSPLIDRKHAVRLLGTMLGGYNIATLVVSLGIPANECVFPENLGKCSTIESRNLRAPTFILVVPLPPLVIEDMRVVEK